MIEAKGCWWGEDHSGQYCLVERGEIATAIFSQLEASKLEVSVHGTRSPRGERIGTVQYRGLYAPVQNKVSAKCQGGTWEDELAAQNILVFLPEFNFL